MVYSIVKLLVLITCNILYFSEELKAVVNLVYEIKLIKGYEFSQANLFESYIK